MHNNRINCYLFLISCLFSILGFSACTDLKVKDQSPQMQNLSITLNPLQIQYAMPGLIFEVEGSGFLENANYDLQLEIAGIRYPLVATYVDFFHIKTALPSTLNLPQNVYQAKLILTMNLENLIGTAENTFFFQFAFSLTPQLQVFPTELFINTPSKLSGNLFLLPGEGEIYLELIGTLTLKNGETRTLQNRFPITASFDRLTATFSLPVSLFELQSESFMGTAKVVQVNQTGSAESLPVNLSFDVLSSRIEAIVQSDIRRGQKLILKGKGFLDDQSNGFSTFLLRGRFTPFRTDLEEQVFEQFSLISGVDDGEQAWILFDPVFGADCQSLDLGANAGVLTAEILPYFSYQPLSGNIQEIQAEPFPIEIEIKPTTQVVYLKFLPAFTDSLRLFGLRNFSGEIIDLIRQDAQNYYTGIQVLFSTSEPTDFYQYAVVEIGGPDPNAQQLFGLDNTSGLDRCNQRLNDQLAGKNVDGGGYGGVFVESFLQLSAKNHPENPLADPLFDTIFQSVIDRPPTSAEKEGNRSLEIQNAIAILSHLIANTLAHEVGHSLGLTTVPGCGTFHTSPGDLQMMDCGSDRPFIERAGLDQRGLANWTQEDLNYLRLILPME
jgi:hypothetical protein